MVSSGSADAASAGAGTDRPPAPGRRRRWLLGGVLAFALVAGAGAWWLTRWLDHDRLVAALAAEVLRSTGRPLHIDGRLSWRLLPWPAVTLQGVRLGNPAGMSRPDMLLARSVAVELALRPLFDRRIELQRIALSGVDLLLETDARGRGNWVFTPPSEPAAKAAPAAADSAAPMSITLARIDIDDSRLVWHGADRAETLQLDSVRVERADNGARLEAQLTLNGQALKLAGKTGGLNEFGAGRAFPVDLVLSLDGAEIAASGSIGDGGIGDGSQAAPTRLALRAKLSGLAGLARASGRALVLPAAVRLPASITASVEQRAGTVTLSAFKLDAAGWAVSGQGKLDFGGRRPRFDLALNAGALDLSAVSAKTAAKTTATPPRPSGKVFSAEPWPDFTLPDAEGQLRFDVRALRLAPKVELQALRGTLTLAPQRLAIDPLAFAVAGGSVSGAFGLRQAAAAAPAITLDARAQGISLEALAAMAGVAGVSGGRSDLRVNLAGSGRSTAQWAGSLNGLVVLDAGPARLSRARGNSLLEQIVDAVNPLGGKGDSTEIQCAAARLPVAAGVASFDRAIGVQSSIADLAASGRIDLGAETLDISLMPSLRKAGVAVGPLVGSLLRLKGPLAEPKLVVDGKGTATAALAIGAAVASGGASVLGQRLLGGPVDKQPCATALKGAAPPLPQAAPAPTPAPAIKLPRLPWKPR